MLETWHFISMVTTGATSSCNVCHFITKLKRVWSLVVHIYWEIMHSTIIQCMERLKKKHDQQCQTHCYLVTKPESWTMKHLDIKKLKSFDLIETCSRSQYFCNSIDTFDCLPYMPQFNILNYKARLKVNKR